MSIFTDVAADTARFLSEQGVTITLTEPGEDPVTIVGGVFRGDMKIDPETNAQINDPYTSVLLPLVNVVKMPEAGWAISVSDPVGVVVSGIVSPDIRVSQSTGQVTLYIEAIDAC